MLHYFIWDGQSKTKNRNIIRRLCSVEGNHIKAHEYNVTREVKTAVRNVMEYLRNESDFGIGDNSVIACEREIANCLKTIENNIPALCNTKTMGKTEKIIIENCKTILINLKLRTERKKR